MKLTLYLDTMTPAPLSLDLSCSTSAMALAITLSCLSALFVPAKIIEIQKYLKHDHLAILTF